MYGGEYLSDPKIERLTPIERSCWVTILCMASMDNGVIKFLTVESLLNRSGIQFDPYHPEEWEKALGVLQKFQNLKMIDCDDDGTILVKNWKKRQESAMTGYERVKKYRAKKKKEQEDDNESNENDNARIEENRIDKNRIEESKNKYGESGLVELTDDEHKKLIETIGEHNTTLLIEELDDYLGTMTPKKAQNKYSSHYKALRAWARRKYQTQKEKVDNKKVRRIA